jgi:hypothetical protein
MDRFDFEQQIQQCWNTKEDIDLLYQEVLEGESDFEKIANTLLGISALHDLRCKKLFENFENLIQDGSL